MACARSPPSPCRPRPTSPAPIPTGYVHVNESHRGHLGTGSIDFTAFFRALAEVGYDGAVTFEAFSAGIGDPVLSDSLAVWRQLWTDTDDLAARARAFIETEWAAARTAAKPPRLPPSSVPGSITSNGA